MGLFTAGLSYFFYLIYMFFPPNKGFENIPGVLEVAELPKPNNEVGGLEELTGFALVESKRPIGVEDGLAPEPKSDPPLPNNPDIGFPLLELLDGLKKLGVGVEVLFLLLFIAGAPNILQFSIKYYEKR